MEAVAEVGCMDCCKVSPSLAENSSPLSACADRNCCTSACSDAAKDLRSKGVVKNETGWAGYDRVR
jgi:hypothetical protein